MLTIFQRVWKFNLDAGTEMGRKEISFSEKNNEINMLQEELDELHEAFKNNDRVEIADALADIIYVAMGTMAKHGMDYERIMHEVCQSNESKYQKDSETDELVLVKNENGKIVKGENFKSPDLSFVADQAPLKLIFKKIQDADKEKGSKVNENV
jgi:predicted HAD superfamily Cof-like phosphohydrolase